MREIGIERGGMSIKVLLKLLFCLQVNPNKRNSDINIGIKLPCC